jgi:hypothetical protein
MVPEVMSHKEFHILLAEIIALIMFLPLVGVVASRRARCSFVGYVHIGTEV